jgi:hypothetical protein
MQNDRHGKGTVRPAATKGIEPRISRMTRIRNDGFPILAIRGKKSSRTGVILADCSAESVFRFHIRTSFLKDSLLRLGRFTRSKRHTRFRGKGAGKLWG